MKTKKRRWLRVLGLLCGVLLIGVLGAGVSVYRMYGEYKAHADTFDLTKLREVSQRSAVYDGSGEMYSWLHGENRLVVPLDRISGWFIQALLAREDSRFWEHEGVDFRGVVRAAWTNLRSSDVRQGASTITQQLARNSLELEGRTYHRKILEALVSQRIEEKYSKVQILEAYSNLIYFGSGFYGVETAARGYFGKHAAELTLGESALLAGLIRSPNKFSPRNDLRASLAERDTVLGRMQELHMIREDDAIAAKAARIAVHRENPLRTQEDYVMAAVDRELDTLLSPEVLALGGLKIFTTVDPQLQRAAQDAADRQLTIIENGKGFPHPKKADFVPGTGEGGLEKPTDYLQAGVVAVDNRTGAIRAIVGGRDYAQSKYHRAVISKRQIGSTFKPFVYAAAFQKGMLPGSLVDDARINAGEFRTIKTSWSPENSDGDYTGLQPAAWGLIKSRNTMAVRVGEYAGLQTVASLANTVGIGENFPPYPAAHLGAFEATLRDLTGSYTIFPNLGIFRPPHLISRVEDSEGRVLHEIRMPEKRVISADSAWMTSAVLQQVMKTGTASKSGQMGWKKPAGGKTGTTNDCFDAWFVGYTSTLTCGVWVGMDKPQTIMDKGYGGSLALPIWVDFMNDVPEKTYPAKAIEPQMQLITAKLCSASGCRATSVCEQAKSAYEANLPAQRIPSQICHLHPEPVPMFVAQPPPAAWHPPYAASMTPPVTAIGNSFGEPSRPITVDLNAPMTTVIGRESPLPGNPVVRVERTPTGMRIYRSDVMAADETDLNNRPAEQPAPPVRVMRAIPVEQSPPRPAARALALGERTDDPAPVRTERRVFRGQPFGD